MLPWEKKQQRNGKENLFNMDRLEELVDELMDELLGDMDPEELEGRNPVVFGFSLKLDGEGKPKIEEFGNVKRKADKLVKTESREPLVDVFRSGVDVTVSVELPGVSKKELKVRSTPSSVVIDVRGEKPYYKEIALGEKIAPNSIKALFKNGILEVSLKTLAPAKGGKEVKVR